MSLKSTLVCVWQSFENRNTDGYLATALNTFFPWCLFLNPSGALEGFIFNIITFSADIHSLKINEQTLNKTQNLLSSSSIPFDQISFTVALLDRTLHLLLCHSYLGPCRPTADWKRHFSCCQIVVSSSFLLFSLSLSARFAQSRFDVGWMLTIDLKCFYRIGNFFVSFYLAVCSRGKHR